MIRESGKALVTGNNGRIDTANDPTPVTYDVATFSKIHDGSDVYFWRSPSDLAWAFKVVLTSEVDELVELATPPSGFTKPALDVVMCEAARFCAEAQFAPTPEDSFKHIEYAKKWMAALPNKLGKQSRPAGVKTLRSILAKPGD